MERKRLLALCGSICLALILVMLPVMAGCKAEVVEVKEGEEEEEEEVGPELPEIHILFAGDSASTDVSSIRVREEIMPMWDELTPNYKIVFEPHYGGEIFPGAQATEALSVGTVQMGGTMSYRDEGFEPRFGIFLIPVLWESFNHIVRFTNSPEWVKVIEDHERDGIKIMHFTAYFMWLSFMNTEVRTLEDMAGMRIRCMESPTMVKAVVALGANPISIVAGELTVAMQTGMFEGMIASLGPAWMRMLGYLDYMNYALEVPITFTATATAFNAQWYDNLPDEVRLAFEEKVLPEWALGAQHLSDADRAEGIALWRAEATCIKPTDAVKRDFVEACMPLFEEYAARFEGQGLIDAALRTLDEEGLMGYTNYYPFGAKDFEAAALLEAARVKEGMATF